ncbi:dirigent protein 17-like isoform X2 [Trifolium pratense]|uniref:dirigent protein 17-like isoform X2 n=1 Tax=Trifolium pratense TaxID=57577 RepID=UPI001E694349|nr:dirigent protein 17-like isoform X2 [Trifolium pratense]
MEEDKEIKQESNASATGVYEIPGEPAVVINDKEIKQESNPSATGVYEIPGEPAVVINGVPEIVTGSGNGSGTDPSIDALNIHETRENMGLGEWFVGRDVQKSFMGRYYSGKVTMYDKQNGWYHVVYEDGDNEDLDWPELKEVLRPLDVKIDLKTLAQKVIRKNIDIKYKARN